MARLPYFDVQPTVLVPDAPSRAIPRGNTHMFDDMSSPQSMDRPVITKPSSPTYIARVHMSASASRILVKGCGFGRSSGAGEGGEGEEQADQQRRHADRQAGHRQLVSGLPGAPG